MLSRHLTSTALVLSLAVLLAACAPPWTSQGPQPLPDAQQIFRPLEAGARNGDLDAFDPAHIQFGTDYNLSQLVFPPLVTLDDHNQVAPWAAERWQPSADGLTWTFHLRSGMKWSDGVPIDASAYAYSINRSLDPCTGSPVAYYLSGTDVELIKGSVAFNAETCPTGATISPDTLLGKSILTPDPQTLVLLLSHPAAYFPTSLTYPTAWAQPKQLIERYGPEVLPHGGLAFNGWTDHLADSGGFGGNLFTVTGWDHAGHLDLVRNEGFWGAKPKLHDIAVTLYKDADAAWADYQAGQGHYINFIPSTRLTTARALPGFSAEPDPTLLYLTPNWNTPPFDDVRVRQAFDLALDRTGNAHTLSLDTVLPTIHMVPEGVPGFNPKLADPAGRVGEAALSPDVARASSLWQSYVDGKFGGDASKAPVVRFSYRAGSQSAAATAAAYQRQWQSAMPGLQLTLEAVHSSPQVHSAVTRQITTAGWVMDYPDPQDFLSLLAHTGVPYNQTGISIPTADAFMDQADTNPQQGERMRQYQLAEQQLVDAVAWIPTGQSLNQYLVRPQVAGGYHERAAESTALAVWQRIYMIKA